MRYGALKNFGWIARLVVVTAFTVVFAATAFSQTGGTEAGPIRSSPAYAEILLRKTELQADLEAVVGAYTEANPRIVDMRFELSSLDKMLEKVFGVRPSETGKLTLALGKLIVKKAALDTEVARLLRTYTKENVEVKRASRRAEIFDEAIKEILK